MNPDVLLPLAELTAASPLPDGITEEGALLVAAVYGVLMLAGLVVAAFWATRWSEAKRAWPFDVDRLRVRPWTRDDAVLVVLVAVGALACAVSILLGFRFLYPSTLEDHPAAVIVLQSLILHGAVFSFVAWLMVKRRCSWTTAFGIRDGHWARAAATGAMAYVATLPLIGLASWVYQFGLNMLGYDTSLQDVALAVTDEAGLLARTYMVLMAVVFAPLFEEILFRGIALPVLVRRFGAVRGILIVSVCFAAVHHHIPSLMALFLLASALSFAYLRTGSLVVPVVMHGLFNAVNMGLLLFIR